MSSGRVESQYLVGSLLALGPLDQQPFFRSVVGELIITMRDTNPHASKARGQPLGRAFPPFDRAPGALGQATRERLDRDRPMFGVTADQLRRSSATRPLLRRQRPCARRPHRGVRHNAGDVGQPQRRDGRTQIGVGAIAGVHQHHAARQAGRTCPTQLLERDLWLGLEADLLGHTRLAPTGAVLRPVFRQIQLIGHRQARMVIGDRQRHGDLTIVLLAELAAVLPRHANRVPPLLGKARVVDDPRLDRPMALDRRQHHLAYFGQDSLVRPSRLADKMQQRLMLRPNVVPAPSPPPSAPRSCARTASPSPCNSPAAVPPGPHDRSRSTSPST